MSLAVELLITFVLVLIASAALLAFGAFVWDVTHVPDCPVKMEYQR